jgi:hypothetical protein
MIIGERVSEGQHRFSVDGYNMLLGSKQPPVVRLFELMCHDYALC